MSIRAIAMLLGGLVSVATARADVPCRARLEVAGPSGIPFVKRAAKTADDGICQFDVRVQTNDDAACAVARVAVRGLSPVARVAAGDGSPMHEWGRVTLSPRGKRARRQMVRARVQLASGRVARARVALECAPEPTLAVCENILAESTHCWFGGGHALRAVGLNSGAVCGVSPEDITDPLPALRSTSLAIWHGDAYTCSSAGGALVAVPVGRTGAPRVLAGGCQATATDGERLLVLPGEDFDRPMARRPGAKLHDTRGRRSSRPLEVANLPEIANPREIRAYDTPEAIATGVYHTAFDLDAIPADSACGALVTIAMTAHDGVVFLAGCPAFMTDDARDCAMVPRICALDTRTGTAQLLVLDELAGDVHGMSMLEWGRLAILSNDRTVLPPIGYDGSRGVVLPSAPAGGRPGGMTRPRPSEPPDQLSRVHVFDTASGARLDTREFVAARPLGLACESSAGEE